MQIKHILKTIFFILAYINLLIEHIVFDKNIQKLIGILPIFIENMNA